MDRASASAPSPVGGICALEFHRAASAKRSARRRGSGCRPAIPPMSASALTTLSSSVALSCRPTVSVKRSHSGDNRDADEQVLGDNTRTQARARAEGSSTSAARVITKTRPSCARAPNPPADDLHRPRRRHHHEQVDDDGDRERLEGGGARVSTFQLDVPRSPKANGAPASPRRASRTGPRPPRVK